MKRCRRETKSLSGNGLHGSKGSISERAAEPFSCAARLITMLLVKEGVEKKRGRTQFETLTRDRGAQRTPTSVGACGSFGNAACDVSAHQCCRISSTTLRQASISSSPVFRVEQRMMQLLQPAGEDGMRGFCSSRDSRR